jgi:preprotein translocase SecF subunit
MGRWMADANYDFLSKTKLAVAASIVVCVGGLAAFAMLPEEEKLGIDFTGGVEALVETAEPQTIETMRARVAAIPEIGESAEVKTVLTSRQGEEAFTQFRIQFKKLLKEGVDLGNELRPLLAASLSDLLLEDPVQVTLRPDGESTRADVALYFETPPDEATTRSVLESVGLRDLTVAPGARVNSFQASGTTTGGRTANELVIALTEAFQKKAPDAMFARAIPSSSQVGPQVVGELRDKALLALAVSLFVTVMYIRVRFAEYSYGIAAIVALVHDVLVTLAALSIANHFDIVNGEISLAMIAVFLTIIGYSVNDTIVIFDRVRENLPKSDKPLRDVLNTSINETLSRTIMTSTTVFLAILVQYLFNVGTGNVLESISFAMIFGTLSGVYSTVYIANPTFLWLETRSQRKRSGVGVQERARREEDRRQERLRKAKDDEGEGQPETV